MQRVLKTWMVWFSSQLSWRSTYVLSSDTSWHHQRLMSVFRDDTDRSGWNHDRNCTTRLLYRTQHSYCYIRHYPDLWWWRDNHDDQKENHQQFLKTTHSNLTSLTLILKNIQYLFQRSDSWTSPKKYILRAYCVSDNPGLTIDRNSSQIHISS